MTAQVPDLLQWNGKSYRLREFIELPATVDPLPEELHVHSTSRWRGYTCRWGIRHTEEGPKLSLLGFDCDEYLPLYQPVENPITATVRVVQEGARCLRSVHMGFESKFEGETELRFEEGRLVGDQVIPDEVSNQDGLLDMAPLFPGGKNVGEKHIRDSLTPPPAPDGAINTCNACGISFAHSRLVPGNNALCHRCWEELYEIAKHMHHWSASAKFTGIAPYLSDRVGNLDSPLVSPEWHRKSRLLGCASFGFSPGKNQVVISFSGYHSFRVTAQLGFACDDDNAERDVCSAAEQRISETLFDSLKQFGAPEVETRIWSDDDRATIMVTLTRDFSIETASTHQTDVPHACKEAAQDLERKMEKVVSGWISDLTKVAKFIAHGVRDAASQMTNGTGIFPHDPGALTPIDAKILRELCWKAERQAKTRWAIAPRHTEHGWIPGQSICDRYMYCLNI